MDLLAQPWLWPRLLLIGLVRAYRLLLKPWLGNACRFEPTCSAYALTALQRHGAVQGACLAGWRLARCHPWCEGGLDPVPERFSNPVAGLFTRFVGPQHHASRPAGPPPPRPSRSPSGDLP